MSVTITPKLTVAVQDSGITADPNPMDFGGEDILCATGALAEDVALAAGASAVAVPLPAGVTTAAVLIVRPTTIADLVVAFKGQTMSVPVGQPAAFYGVAAGDVTLSSALGGQVTALVGG